MTGPRWRPSVRRRGRVPSRARGQSLVEFSIAMVFLLVLLMGVLDLARAYFTYLALKDAAAEGAYFASAFPQCTDADGFDALNPSPACADPNNVPVRVVTSAPQGGLVDWSDATIATTLPVASRDDLQAGQVLTVSVSYTYQMITPFVSAIAEGQELTLSASSAAVIVRVPNCEDDPAGCT
jgi:Flp pilus assembly protein TadG